MFHRITVENWQNIMAITSFSIFFSVFILTLLRMWRMKQNTTRHLASLPLADDTHE